MSTNLSLQSATNTLLSSTVAKTEVDPGDLITASAAATTQTDLKERFQTLQIIGGSLDYHYSIITPQEKTSGLRYDRIQDKIADAKTICLGDLHGSYEKLVETLISTGLATMPKESALKFVKASKELEELVSNNPYLETITPQEPPKSTFERLMERVFKTPQKESPTAIAQAKILQSDLIESLKTLRWTGAEGQKLILIGDMIGDRGVSDTLTLTVLSHLSKEDPNRLIRIASNHDHCAANFLLNGERTMNHDESQARAFKLSDNHTELRELYLNHLKELKLLHYDKSSKTLYSHAPITPENFESLIANLKEEGFIDQELGYKDINDNTIEEFIEIANQFYKEAVTFPFENGLSGFDPIAEQTLNDSKDGFFWKRCQYSNSKDLPLVNQGVETVVHGHDKSSGVDSPFAIDRRKYEGEIKTKVVNLDNTVRKSPGFENTENCRLFVQ